jgi:transcriptional regulator with XRE-family HTH domain
MPTIRSVRQVPMSKRPFGRELPRLLKQRGLTLRALAEAVGGFDHAYLSRMMGGQRSVNTSHLRRIARYLDLPEDYFPEVREKEVVDAVRNRPGLRDEIYFTRLKRKPPQAR